MSDKCKTRERMRERTRERPPGFFKFFGSGGGGGGGGAEGIFSWLAPPPRQFNCTLSPFFSKSLSLLSAFDSLFDSSPEQELPFSFTACVARQQQPSRATATAQRRPRLRRHRRRRFPRSAAARPPSPHLLPRFAPPPLAGALLLHPLSPWPPPHRRPRLPLRR